MSNTWTAVAELAARLNNEGHLCTQLHTTSDSAPDEWCDYRSCGAAVFKNAEVDMVVTSDGVKHYLEKISV